MFTLININQKLLEACNCDESQIIYLLFHQPNLLISFYKHVIMLNLMVLLAFSSP